MLAPNTFTGGGLDRAAEHRNDAAWLADRAAEPAARAVLVGSEGIAVAAGEQDRAPRRIGAGVPPGAPEDGRGHDWDEVADAAELALVALAEVPPGAGEPLLLGLGAGGPLFAVDADPPRPPVTARPPLVAARGAAPARDGRRMVGLRHAAAALAPGDAGLAAHAAALVNWHRRHGHCAVCGHATAIEQGGAARRCGSCGTSHHPRTDPVAIMVVADGRERVLLGRQPSWPAGRYSALAGFVEPGESLEETVAREVREEAGVEVGAPVYLSSQPWPFPGSLMCGFVVPYAGGEPRRVDRELEDVRWFTRAEVLAATRGDGAAPLGLPPRYAIARRLLDAWLQQN